MSASSVAENEGAATLIAAAERLEREAAGLRQLAACIFEPAEPAPEAWLTPDQLAERLSVGAPYLRKRINHGVREGLPGFARRGGRLFATVDAVRRV